MTFAARSMSDRLHTVILLANWAETSWKPCRFCLGCVALVFRQRRRCTFKQLRKTLHYSGLLRVFYRSCESDGPTERGGKQLLPGREFEYHSNKHHCSASASPQIVP